MRMGCSFIILIFRWDSLPIIQSYVKQKLGEAPERKEKPAPKAKIESLVTPTVPKSVMVASSLASAVEGEQWDPNRQLDKLKSGVLNKLLEQQKKRSPKTSQVIPGQFSVGEGMVGLSDIDVSDGIHSYPFSFTRLTL